MERRPAWQRALFALAAAVSTLATVALVAALIGGFNGISVAIGLVLAAAVGVFMYRSYR